MAEGLTRLFVEKSARKAKDMRNISLEVYENAVERAKALGVETFPCYDDTRPPQVYNVKAVDVNVENRKFGTSICLTTEKGIDMEYVSTLLGLNESSPVQINS